MLPTEAQVVDDEAGVYDDDDDKDDVDDGHEGHETGGNRVQDEPIPTPPSPFDQPPTFETGGFSSSTHMLFNFAFLHSFSALQLEVFGIQEECIGMHDDIHHLYGRMKSIEEGVTYF